MNQLVKIALGKPYTFVVLAILLIPAALCFTFGAMAKDRRQGWAVLAAMTVIFALFVLLTKVLFRKDLRSNHMQLAEVMALQERREGRSAP